MKFINNQYKVVRIIREEKYGSTVLVEDIEKGNLIKNLRIVNQQKETQDFIEHMKYGFYEYANIVHPNFAEFHFFNRIRFVDNKYVIFNKFYYTYDYIEGQKLSDFLENKDFSVFIDMAMQLCSAMYHLHLRGFLLSAVDLDELLVVKEADKYVLKIMSFPYPENSSISIMLDKPNNYFLPPETFQSNRLTRLSDIYMFGKLMMLLLFGSEAKKSSIVKLIKINNKNNDEYYKRFCAIIEKCISLSTVDRYQNILQIAEDISKSCNVENAVVKKKYVNKLNSYRIKPIGRINYINRIIHSAKGNFYENRPNKATLVAVPSGTGKIDFLKALEIKSEQEGFNVASLDLNTDAAPMFYCAAMLIKSIIKNIDKELVDKYFNDLNSILPEITGDRNENAGVSIVNLHDRSRTVFRLSSFLAEVSQKLPYIIIIDSLNKIDDETLEILKLTLTNELNPKIYLVATDDNEDKSQEVKLFQAFLPDTGLLDYITLGNFSLNETAEFVRLILATDKVPFEFAAKLYRLTDGSPDYINELINILFSSGAIYVDDKGKWVLEKIDIEDMNISFNIDEITYNKIAKLDPLYKNILEGISVFNIAVSSDIIQSMLGMDNDELFNYLNYLSYKNVLTRKVDDWGISYDYRSQNLKKAIYEKLEPEKRVAYHKKASYLLEDKFLNEKRENKDELIYQMTRADRYDEAINHLIRSAERMADNGMFGQAIQFLEQTMKFFRPEDTSSEKTKVCFKLSQLYETLGEYDNALRYTYTAESLLLNADEGEMLCDVYIQKYALLYKMNDTAKALKYAAKAKHIIKAKKYYKGLYTLVAEIYYLFLNRRKNNYYSRLVESILSKMDAKRYEYYYGILLISYGNARINRKNYIESMEIIMKGVEILERLDSFKDMPRGLNALGYIHSEYISDLQKAREYYEKSLTISIKTNNLFYMEVSYNNLAEIYREEDKYKEAREYYEKALEYIKVSRDKYDEILVYLNSILVNISSEDYKNAAKYLNEGKKLIHSGKEFGNLREFALYCEASFYHEMGYNELAREYSQKAVDMCISWGITENLEAKLVAILSEIKLSDAVDYQREMGFVQRVYAENLYKLGRAACVRFVHIYTDKGLKQQAEQFFQLGLSYRDKIETDVLKYEYLYAEAVMEEDPAIKLEKLLSLIEQMDLIESNEMKYRICYGMAMELKNRGDKYEALRYLISALNYLRRLVYNVPDEYKVKFVMSHGRNRVREELVGISSGIKAANGIKEEEEDRRETMNLSLMSMDKYFDYTEFRDIYRYKELEGRETEKAIDIEEQGRSLRKIQELVGKFTEDDIGNLKHAISLLAEITQAKTAFIAVLEEDNSMEILASYNRYTETPFYKYIIEQAKQKKSSIMINDVFEYSRKKGDILIPKEITALFCIPITAAQTTDGVGIVEEKRRNKETGLSQIVGYIYLDTDSIINNFTEESGKFCSLASKVIYILVDNYNLKIVSTVDKLTKLYTRKYFETALQNEMAYVEREGGEFSIIMIDIDRFKTVNDRFGHQKGDEVLQNVSSIIMGAVRKGDICGRYGGEEIIIMLPSTNSRDGLNVAEKIRKKIENARLLGLHTPLTVSLGVSSYPEHSTWIKDLIEKADQALYYAKESGRNMSCMYQGNMSKSVKRIDKLAGIISGNQVEDQRRVETMLEILELQRSIELSHRDKVYNFLGRVIEVSEAQTGILFYIEEGNKISGRLIRKKLLDVEVGEAHYNESLVYKCMESRQGEYQLDWSGYPGVDTVTGMPDWQSVMVVPLTNKGELRGVLYLTVSMKNREYDAESYNYIKTLCNVFSIIFD